MHRKDRIVRLNKLLDERILVLDGALGTMVQSKNLTASDFGGVQLEGFNENLSIVRPEIVEEIHNAYLDAGSDIIETNTFGATPIVLAEYDKAHSCYEINLIGAQIARSCADKYTKMNPAKPRFVAGSMGPTTKAISVTGGVTFSELIDNYHQQALGLYDGGIDYFLIETSNDTRNVKAAIIAITNLLEDKEDKIPIAVSATIEQNGTMLAGQDVESLIVSLEHIDLLYIGLNCATGPDLMTEHIRSMSKLSNTRIACVPNAGLPDEDGNYLDSPMAIATALSKFIEQGWINLLGGCCGTTPDYIAAISEVIGKNKPRKIEPKLKSCLSGINMLEITNEKRPIMVGERTNVIGSKKFRNLITSGEFDMASDIAKEQIKMGAEIIDICLSNPDSNEYEDMKQFLEFISKKVKVPLMIDSMDERVVDMALSYSQGKAIINSINLEEGEKRFEKIAPLTKKYGAALVIGTIDEDPKQGMALTAKRKLQIAKRSHSLLTKKYGLKEEDLYFDPLVFPCATGDSNYVGSAAETIKGIELIKQSFPKVKTVLGLSNVSFGLPMSGREVLNSVFLYHCTKAGLDLAIVNSQKVKRFSTLTQEEIRLAEDLLFNRVLDPITPFVSYYRDKVVEKKQPQEDLPVEQRISSYVVEGLKVKLTQDLDELLKKMKPIDVINGPLMDGMKEVGKLFSSNKLIVAEVLQSAEVMKASVDHLQPFMQSDESAFKGTFLLATVKGDVHDIGKNLVDIIFSNNGFKVINLGIKISSAELIKAVEQHRPDVIGLSGLLVKSAHQMADTASDLALTGIDIPMIIGGAALSKNFTYKQVLPAYKGGEVLYAKDAMEGLELANTIMSEEKFNLYKEKFKDERYKFVDSKASDNEVEVESIGRSPQIIVSTDLPMAPDYQKHVIKNTPIETIFKYINPKMLYSKHLGIDGKIAQYLMDERFDKVKEFPQGQKALEIYDEIKRIKAMYAHSHLNPSAVYQYFKCNSDKNTIELYHHQSGEVINTFCFPRQLKADGICLSDFVAPKDHGVVDNMGMFIVTVGKNIIEEVQRLKVDGKYFQSHVLQALAIELAEAYAEYLHSKMRQWWGYADPVDATMLDLFQAKYRGRRFSVGYAACPNMEDQTKIFQLLDPSHSIGVSLTESYMMDPEASVSALVFHHPEAKYFSVT
ncbi:MAG: methionine synthase [Bacteriovoracaceae bacterium]|nr:methionine synthase [Bacteriovoracaceae bacterium]